jgi:surfactin synthase thioesterase subunit
MAEGSWVLRPRPNSAARVRLFAFPYAGGGGSAFRTWASDLPPDVELCAVQMPGRESRWKEPPYTRMDALVPALHDGLLPYLDRPYAFFGHSLGALTSFELARALRRSGRPGPVHLFASAHRAPQCPNPHPDMRHLEDGPFVDEIRRRYGGIPQAVLEHPELMALMLPCLRADFTVFETYSYGDDRPLECPISTFGGQADDYVRQDALEAWATQTTGGFSLRMLPGDHFFVQGSRASVVATVTAALARAPQTVAGTGGR